MTADHQAARVNDPDGSRLDDPYECDICGESLPDGGYRCPDCEADARSKASRPLLVGKRPRETH